MNSDKSEALSSRLPPARVRVFLAMALIVVFAITLGLRLSTATSTSLSLDEATLVWHAAQPSDTFRSYLARDATPPLHATWTRLQIATFGSGLISIRLPSLLCSALAGCALSWLAWRWWGVLAGLLAGILWAASSVQQYYAQEARAYVPGTLFAVCSFLLLDRLCDAEATRRRPLRFGLLAAYVLTTGLMLASHYLLFLVLFAQGLWLIIARRKAIRGLLPAYAGIGLIAAPLLLRLTTNQGSEAARWYSPPSVRDALKMLVDLAGSLSMASLVVLALVALAGSAAIARRPILGTEPVDRFSDSTSGRLLLLLCWIMGPLTVLLVVGRWVPVTEIRHVLFLHPPLVLAIAYLPKFAGDAIARLQPGQDHRRTPPLIALATVLTIAAVAIVQLQIDPKRSRPRAKGPWQAIAQAVEHSATATTLIAVSPSYFCKPFAYTYAKEAFFQPGPIGQHLFARDVLCVNELETLRGIGERTGPRSWILVDASGSNRDRGRSLYPTLAGAAFSAEQQRFHGVTVHTVSTREPRYRP